MSRVQLVGAGSQLWIHDREVSNSIGGIGGGGGGGISGDNGEKGEVGSATDTALAARVAQLEAIVKLLITVSDDQTRDALLEL